MNSSIRMKSTIWVHTIFMAIWVQYAVWTLKLPRILDRIERKSRKVVSDEELLYRLHLIDQLSNTKWFVIRRNCLKKNLLYYYGMVTSGITGLTLHIGISKPNLQLDGHCWLTWNEQVYLDSENKIAKYTVMYSRGV